MRLSTQCAGLDDGPLLNRANRVPGYQRGDEHPQKVAGRCSCKFTNLAINQRMHDQQTQHSYPPPRGDRGGSYWITSSLSPGRAWHLAEQQRKNCCTHGCSMNTINERSSDRQWSPSSVKTILTPGAVSCLNSLEDARCTNRRDEGVRI